AAMRCQNVENVYIIYRRTKEFMPADKEEFHAALEDGVIFKDLLLPVILDNGTLSCQKMMLDEIGEDGRRDVIPVQGQFEEFQIDTIISAIGEQVDIDILSKNKIKLKNKSAVVTGTNETSLENVYIGGDALRGPSTVVEAIADGRTAADAIIKKEGVQPLTAANTNRYFDPKLRESDIILRKGLAASQKVDDIIAEAGRCLDCNFICTKCVEVCPNRANITIDTSDYNDIFTDRYQILHLESLCNECGNCETFCPHTGSPYKDKITFFKNETEFKTSSNDGFYFVNNESEDNVKIMIRTSAKSSELTMDINGNIEESSLTNIDSKNEFEKLAVIIGEVYKNYKYLWNETTI
ncbi:FAD-dependent oxidoreductase, partial [Bacteroidota bacterium]